MYATIHLWYNIPLVQFLSTQNVNLLQWPFHTNALLCARKPFILSNLENCDVGVAVHMLPTRPFLPSENCDDI